MLHTRYTTQGRRKRLFLRLQQRFALALALVLCAGFCYALLRYMVVWDAHAAVAEENPPVVQASSPLPTPSAAPAVPSPTPSTAAVTATPSVTPSPAPDPTPTQSPTPSVVLVADADKGRWSYACDDFKLSILRVSPQERVTATVAVLSEYVPGTVSSAFAQGQYGRNLRLRTADIASEAGALFAINGDYCGYRSDGIIVRGGVLYRNEPQREMLAIYADGRMEFVEEAEADLDAMLADGLQDTYSFGPVLVREGEVPERIPTDVPGKNPRTAVGQTEDGRFVFVVVDGRQSSSEGMDIHELAEYMLALGCVNAYNLDGGMTSCMYFNGEVISSPCGTAGRERTVSDILCIYPVPEETPADEAAPESES